MYKVIYFPPHSDLMHDVQHITHHTYFGYKQAQDRDRIVSTPRVWIARHDAMDIHPGRLCSVTRQYQLSVYLNSLALSRLAHILTYSPLLYPVTTAGANYPCHRLVYSPSRYRSIVRVSIVDYSRALMTIFST
jgi:hypothetical protein